MKHYLIVYHAHCNDGFGAAWAIRHGLNRIGESRSIQLHEAGYGSPVPLDKITRDTIVYIVDFSYPPQSMLLIAEQCCMLTWIDHHKTAIEAWIAQVPVETTPLNMVLSLDQSKSGAMLAWEYMRGVEEAPRILKHIQDRDLWKFELAGTKEIHLNLSTQPKEMKVWDEIISNCDIFNEYYKSFIAEGAAIQRYYNDTIAGIIATNKVICYIDGIKGLACNAPGRFASDIGHILATESGTYGLTWEEQNGGIEKCSLRSNGDYDVAVIAKSFGGGGHKNAAGFVIDLNTNNNIRIKFASI